MRRLHSGTRLSRLLRSFAIQGSWNYRTLIGHGFAFALLPALRAIHRGDPEGLREAIGRHAQLFNGHPYLAPMALGAVAGLEADGAAPQVVERFKTAVRGSLGTIGDRLVWAGWRPVCILFTLALLLAGAAGWVAVATFLVVYNAGHLVLRVWSLRLGLREGVRIGEYMRHSSIGGAQRVVPVFGSFLVGLVVPLAVAGRHVDLAGLPDGGFSVPWLMAAATAAVIGIRMGSGIRTPVILALLGFTLLGLLMRVLQ